MSAVDAAPQNPLGLAWCPACDEQCIPLRNGCCPWCDAATVGSTQPPAKEAPPVPSAHALTKTRDCTTPGCTNEAKWSAGMYAGLCEEHANQKRETRAAAPPTGGGRRNGSSTDAGGGFEAKVKELARLGRDVDKLTVRSEAAAVALRRARQAVAEAEERFRALAAELVGNAGSR